MNEELYREDGGAAPPAMDVKSCQASIKSLQAELCGWAGKANSIPQESWDPDN